MKSISVITNARLGSSRVFKKLVRPFAGSSLLQIALSKLNQMDFFEHRYLAVAEPELIDIGKSFPNVEILQRDQEAVKPGVNPLAVTFAHYLRVPSDYLFVFNPCLPCIRIETIKNAFDYFQSTDFNSYTSVVPTGEWIFDSSGKALTISDPRNVTTNMDMTFFKGCHAFHIINKNFFRDKNILWTFNQNDPHLVRISEDEAIDVDTPAEFDLAEQLFLKSYPVQSYH
jgi:CMP-N-acetylneuraminic acid synthetase